MEKSIKCIRNELGMTQGEVAKEAGLSQSHYCEIENGTAAPSVSVAKRIASILDFDWTKFYENDEQAITKTG